MEGSDGTHALIELERRLVRMTGASATQVALDDVRHWLKVALSESIGADPTRKKGLDDILQEVRSSPVGRRKAALILLRSFSAAELIPSELRHSVLEIIEGELMGVLQTHRYNVAAQTYDKIRSLQSLVSELEMQLRQLAVSKTVSIDSLLALRQPLLKSLSKANWYLEGLASPSLKADVQATLAALEGAAKAEDSMFAQRLKEAEEHLDELLERNEQSPFPVDRIQFHTFLTRSRSAVSKLRERLADRLDAKLTASSLADPLPTKLYALHDVDRVLKIQVPLINLGPASALDVRVAVTPTSSEVVVTDEVNLGTIRPGPFSLTLEVLLEKPQVKLTLNLALDWSTPGSPARQTLPLSVQIGAQDPGVDWHRAALTEPYTTGVAEGDAFVGRGEKVQSLGRRLLRLPSQSSYVTGQKRIGKTSLAKAVRDHVLKQANEAFRFLYLEWGQYAREDARAAVRALGNELADFLLTDIPDTVARPTLDFVGTLAPLIKLARIAHEHRPTRRYVIILDEFDEIHPEMYRAGPLAEALFSNIRTLSSEPNIALLMVGGENMPFIMAAQGDQLNKFQREPVDYFSRTTEWQDYGTLIRNPTAGVLSWREVALQEIYERTNGHPYYTKLLCSSVFQAAVRDRDADITANEVRRAYYDLLGVLDVPSFSHYWRDGILADKNEEEAYILRRARVLSCVGRAMRQDERPTFARIAPHCNALGLNEGELQAVLREFVIRGVLSEKEGRYSFVVPLFGDWLRDIGLTQLIVDSLGEEIARTIEKAEDAAYVRPLEVDALVKHWSIYKGRTISGGEVRAWLEQRESLREQRMLFKLLQRLRFLSESEVREKLRVAYSMVTPHVPPRVQSKRSDRRRDLLVTYVDGEAKSGQFHAARFAEENSIDRRCVIEPRQFAARAEQHEIDLNTETRAVIIVDDIVGTGESLSGHVSAFIAENLEFLKNRNPFVGVIALLATAAGEDALRATLSGLPYADVDLRICETLDERYIAFPDDGMRYWENAEQMQAAKALCRSIGARLWKTHPFGYGDQGLLVVFPSSCPNNTLPLLNLAAKEPGGWQPLFPRGS